MSRSVGESEGLCVNRCAMASPRSGTISAPIDASSSATSPEAAPANGRAEQGLAELLRRGQRPAYPLVLEGLGAEQADGRDAALEAQGEARANEVGPLRRKGLAGHGPVQDEAVAGASQLRGHRTRQRQVDAGEGEKELRSGLSGLAHAEPPDARLK